MFEKEEKHASWGMVGFYRTQCSGRQCFGSDVTNSNTIRLTVKHAEKHRELGRDWCRGDDTICEIELTAMQFAELLTNMNCGDGVPCTITYTNNEGHIKYKPEKSKIDLIREERDEKIDGAFSALKEVEEEIACLINNKKIAKSVGSELSHKLSVALSNLEGYGYNFYKKQATEEIDKMVVEAKSQISEYIAAKVYSVGLETLMKGADITPKLNGGNSDGGENE